MISDVVENQRAVRTQFDEIRSLGYCNLALRIRWLTSARDARPAWLSAGEKGYLDRLGSGFQVNLRDLKGVEGAARLRRRRTCSRPSC